MESQKQWSQLLIVGGLASLTLILLFYMIQFHHWPGPFQEEYTLFHSVKVGMTEKEVLDLLGEPYKVYEVRTAPVDYYIPGYSHKKRAITSKVYIYFYRAYRLYI